MPAEHVGRRGLVEPARSPARIGGAQPVAPAVARGPPSRRPSRCEETVTKPEDESRGDLGKLWGSRGEPRFAVPAAVFKRYFGSGPREPDPKHAGLAIGHPFQGTRNELFMSANPDGPTPRDPFRSFDKTLCKRRFTRALERSKSPTRILRTAFANVITFVPRPATLTADYCPPAASCPSSGLAERLKVTHHSSTRCPCGRYSLMEGPRRRHCLS
jgi:hypothetical protein